MGGEGGKVKIAEQPINVEGWKARTAQMGEGVTFVSAEKVKNESGASGERATYAFRDITKLKLSSEPAKPAPGGMAAAGPGGVPAPTSKSEETPITFDFAKGIRAKLIVNLPQNEAPEETTGTPASMPAAETSSLKQVGQPKQIPPQMKQMFEGFRCRMIVKVDGEIVKTNASFVDKNEKDGRKNLVTIFDMDIGKLLENQEQFLKLSVLGPIRDMETAREMLKDFPGIKVETKEKVEIEFK